MDDRPPGPDGGSEPATADRAADGWAPASFPVDPAETADGVLDIPGATLSGFAIGRLRTIEPPSRWTRGAVYDAAGMLVEASQRIGGTARDVVVAADPARFGSTPAGWLRRVTGGRRFRGRRLNGTWLYAGTWMHQFGHFVTETVTTLWPDPIDVAGLVAHPFAHLETRYPWQTDLVELSGYGARPLVLALEPVRVERLLVPTRPFVAAAYATPMAVRAWERIAEAATGAAGTPEPSGNVFLSRSRFHRRTGDASRLDTRRLENEEELDELMRSRGWRVIYPEEMPIGDQVRAVRSARVIAGMSGSALHLAAFAPSGTRVLEIGDLRSGGRPVRNQRVIDAVRGHLTAFVPLRGDEPRLALGELARLLDELGTQSGP
ncbi:MAG: glycosyltransferase family 61 protein [Chloroflexota bacterium]